MSIDSLMTQRRARAARYAALGDPKRLHMVEALALSDLTSSELGTIVGIPSNLLAHHVGVLEAAGIVERRASAGDRRRRYIQLRHETVADGLVLPRVGARLVLFVCRRNSARSQLAAAIWNDRSVIPAESAGADPSDRVHPGAVRVAARHGLDLSGAVTRSYEEVVRHPDLVVSVCDFAHEAADAFTSSPHLHWSMPDPAETGTDDAFEAAWAGIERHVSTIAPVVSPGAPSEPQPYPFQRRSTAR